MDKKFYLAAIAGIATLIVFGGCGQEAEDTSILFPTPTEIEQDEDFDFEFDPTAELSVTPAGEWEQATPTLTEEIPDDEGNLPDEGDLELMDTPIPEPTATLGPTPTKEVVPTPTEAPTATPEPTAIPEPEEEVATVAPTPTTKPTKVPTEAVKATEEPKATPTPTEEPKPTEKPKATPTPKPTESAKEEEETKPTKAESKEPTMEKDGYSFKDPTGLKAGATVGTLTSGMGKEVTIIHHEVGDLIEAWNDGLENNCTYRYHKDSHSYELICYGKYQPKSSDKNVYYYNDASGYQYKWKNGSWNKDAVDVVANACVEPREQISFTTEGTESGTSSGTWQ